MACRVVTAPAPVVTAADLGSEFAANPAATLVIAAVTAKYDGPNGRLGLCLGPQVLELVTAATGCRIPLRCGPFIEVISITVISDGADHAVDDAAYRLDPSGEVLLFGALPAVSRDWLKIQYRAGYEPASTGPVPDPLRQAIILESRLTLQMVDASLFIKAEEVEGVGRTEFTLPEQVSRVVEKAVDSLVSGFKVSHL
jgi:hypothetical protein